MYTIHRATDRPRLRGEWDGATWRQAETLDVALFHPRSSDHHPRTQARVLHDGQTIYVHFRVQDRHVVSKVTQYQGAVCKDSCVEFFVAPRPDRGYFNFEINAGGALHVSYVEDPTRTPTGFAKFTPLDWALGRQVQIYHSLPAVVDPELPAETTWQLEYAVPVAILEAHTGSLGPLSGQTWRANFYKCGDNASHPHWASWAPIGPELNFHVPQYFVPVTFA